MPCDRTAFYSLALFTACLQTVFGLIAGFLNGSSPFLYIFGKLAAGVSIATWIWLGVLIRYNRLPVSTHPLTRSAAHVISFGVLVPIWIAIGIMIATQMPFECRAQTLWCAAACFSSALAFLTAIFSLVAAILVYRAASSSGAGLAINVAQANKRHLHEVDNY